MTGRPADDPDGRSAPTDDRPPVEDDPDGRSPVPNDRRPPGEDPQRSTDGAGAAWRNRDSTRRGDPPANEQPKSTVTAPVVGLLTVSSRIVLDALTLGLWVIFLTLLFLEANWPQWAFYGALLGGVAVYVSITAPWTGRPRSTE